jgi:acyl-CoA synthetase (AMP-forming)/AMP-acid ligase II
VRADPDSRVMTFLERGEEETDVLTIATLDRQARALAASLQRKVAPGERALLFFKPGLSFAVAYWGCLYAGVVAVPVPSPGVRALVSESGLRAVARDCAATLLLTTADIAARLDAAKLDAGALTPLAIDDVPDALADTWRAPPLGPQTIAHLQYSSGSTGEPKGVVITHANVLGNLEVISISGGGYREGDAGVNWLPMFHDMGLITTVLLPVYSGAPSWYMSPLAFLQRPLRWLSAISAVRATCSAAPNFALDMCVAQVGAQERAELDLSSMRALAVGSEPTRSASVHRFVEAFTPSGFDVCAMSPCYGLAEATLQVSGGPLGRGITELAVAGAELSAGHVAPARGDARTRTLVGCGEVSAGIEVAIVDPQSCLPLPGDTVGEILVRGVSVASGYWNNQDATAQTFAVEIPGRGGGFMRTGDLGFLLADQLYVTGRLKDLLIVNGQNHYPHDFELTAALSHPALRRDGCVAFAVDDEGGERIVIVAEVQRRARKLPADSSTIPQHDVVTSVRSAIARDHDVTVHDVVLVRRVPRTSSGKLRRRACRDMYLEGSLAAGSAR